jgi:hypothetical protein
MAESTNRPSIKNISAFKTRLAGGGARPNLFEVALDDFPAEISGLWDGESKMDFRFLCKAAALPASNVAPIDVPFRGRILKVAGDRTFDTWTVTIINDEDFKLRHGFEAWMNLLSKLDNATGATNPASYMKNATVYQLGRSNKKEGTKVVNQVTSQGPGFSSSGDGQATVLRSYKLYDLFPTNVSQIDLSYDSSDTVEEFTVEFQVQYFEINDGPQSLL